MYGIKILAIGSALGNKLVTNDDLSKIVDTSDEWITTRTGIKTRYISDNLNTSDLAYLACKDMNVSFDDVDLIIVATITPDCSTPSTACLLQEKLGLNGKTVMAFDINAACSGFVYALNIATNMLQTYNKALVIGADLMSKITDYKDRNSCVLFADAASGVLIEKTNTLNYKFYANSIGDNNKILYANGLPLTNNLINNINYEPFIRMNGQEVFRFAVNAIPKAIKEVCNDITNIDLIIPHQANIRIIEYVSKKLNIPLDKFYCNLNKYGNTTAASVPLALHDALKNKIIGKDSKIVLVAFGAGFTYASSYIEL